MFPFQVAGSEERRVDWFFSKGNAPGKCKCPQATVWDALNVIGTC
jgi:hypothetical protein